VFGVQVVLVAEFSAALEWDNPIKPEPLKKGGDNAVSWLYSPPTK
jgi:hypothetical protein